MSRAEFSNVPLKGTTATAQTGTSTPVLVDRFRDKAVAFVFTNSFAGAIQLEGTMDGTNWFSIGSSVTTTGTVVTWAYTVKSIRTNTTAATSGGVATATFGGHDFRAV